MARFAAFARALAYQVALKVGDCGEQGRPTSAPAADTLEFLLEALVGLSHRFIG
jgi:hypothetical protein